MQTLFPHNRITSASHFNFTCLDSTVQFESEDVEYRGGGYWQITLSGPSRSMPGGIRNSKVVVDSPTNHKLTLNCKKLTPVPKIVGVFHTLCQCFMLMWLDACGSGNGSIRSWLAHRLREKTIKDYATMNTVQDNQETEPELMRCQ
ncbi:hypothetical protein SUGI_0599480 [Cryptomeria japonica]|nr:hypothetical protein SUGI_0599480 [Cryptomeria japonica]